MLNRRSFIIGAGALLATAGMARAEQITLGGLHANYLGEDGGIQRWAYRSSRIDSDADLLPFSPEYQINVVLPDSYPAGGPYPVLYVGAVNVADVEGLEMAKALDLHNAYQTILVGNTFKSIPWYGSKSDGTQRVDAHVVGDVFKLLDKAYDTAPGRDGKLLLGYSKSGWGAVSLLLRHPDKVGYAASWDAPFDYPWTNRSIQAAFGTEARFRAHDPKTILSSRLASVSDRARLFLGAGFRFDADHTLMTSLLTDNQVPYLSRYVREASHDWLAEWMKPAVQALFEMRAA